MVHEVLEKGLSDKAAPEDVEQAVADTGDIEKRLNESAETLDQINEALARVAKGSKD